MIKRVAVRSIEGYVVMITGFPRDSSPEDVQFMLGKYGEVKGFHMNTDHKTSFVKGYALVLYQEEHEARCAIAELKGLVYEGQRLEADWAYKHDPKG